MRSSVKGINKNQSWGLTLGLNPNKYSVLISFLFRSLLAMIVVSGGVSVAAAGIAINPVSLQSAIQVERQAGEETGTTTAMHGDIYIKTPSGDLKINRSFILQQGDEIVTGSNAFLGLTLHGGSHITLGENSAMIAARMSGDFSFPLALGKFKAWVKVVQGCRFRVRRPSVSIAVRGTKFNIDTTASGTSVVARIGIVEVTPSSGKAVMVKAGWRFHVDPDGRNKLEIMGGISLLTPDVNTTRMRGMI